MDSQSWVVGALTNKDASGAQLLLQSVNRTQSRLKSTIVVSELVTETIREELRQIFDHVISLKGSYTVKDWDIFVPQVILECFETRLFGSFIYIDCESLVTKNIDHLLKTDATYLNRLPRNGTILLLSFTKSHLKTEKKITGFNEMINNWTVYNKCLSYEEITSASVLRSTRIISLRSNNKKYQKNELLSTQGMGINQLEMELHKRLSTAYSPTIETPIDLEPKSNNGNVGSESVAIVGMSLRFPGANNPDEFWSLLSEGREGVSSVPDCRWNEKYCKKDSKAEKVQAGFLSFAVDEFDSKLFNLSPMEASYMDPQQRMVLELVWEALEDAGISPTNLKGSQTGVFGGWWRDDFKEMIHEASDNRRSKFLRTYMGNTLGTVTSRVSHVLGLTGPCVSTESGCSTSMVAVDLALKALQRNECSTAVAFGVNLFIRSFGDNDFPSSVVAPDGRSKAFDAKADGFGRAEGCAVLVLKRCSDAMDDNDRILGVIRGSAVVQDGESGSLGTPTVNGEALAMQLALKRAGVDPKDVEYVESHGTGTPVGDPLEMAAIAMAYSCAERKKPLVVGSVKTNIGHTESTSGIAGIIKTLLALEHETIPKHINFESLNPLVKLEAVPAVLPLEPVEWKKHSNGRQRLAGVSSFGITGTNAHVILQEPPIKTADVIMDSQPLHILKMSAASETGLNDIKTNYANFLQNQTATLLRDIVFSVNTGRADLSYRHFVTGNSREELVKGILRTPGPSPYSGSSKICFLFTGQGSQSIGMSRELYNSHPLYKSSMDFCFNFLKKHFSLNLQEVMWDGDIETLSKTKYSQPGIFCVEYCLLKLWESWGIRPDCVLGHSLGEFAAAVAAGIISVEDALTLVATRSILIDKLENGSMLVLKGNKKLALSLIEKLPGKKRDEIDIAAMNTEDQTVVAGTIEAISELKELCKNNNVKSSLLKATHAFHSRMMDPMLEEYMETAKKIQHKLPTCTYISGMEGTVKESLEPLYWKHHTSKWVNFLKASSTVLEDVGCDIFLEVGPQPILSSFILENKSGTAVTSCFPSLRKSEDEWMTMLTTLGNLYQRNVSVDWESFHQFCGGSKVRVPYYPFQRKSIPFPETLVKDFYPSVHALLGSQVSNISETKIFQKVLRLEDHPFLKDHVVGPLLLYPGAAFLETCLVAGYTGSQCLEGSFQTPLYPICMEKFQIKAPLSLQDQNSTKLQSAVVEKENKCVVSVGSQSTLEDGTKKWIQHASGIFQPFENLEKGILNSIPSNLSNLRKTFQEEVSLGNFYEDLSEEGLKFGPAFRTIGRVWQNLSIKDQILVEVNWKSDGEGHLLHPVVIDAMIQASIFSKFTGQKKVTLAVPISVDKFVWYKKLKTPECFVHIKNLSYDPENPTSTQVCLTLFDAEGERVAIMLEPTIVETTLAALLRSIEVNTNSLPAMYEDVWRTQRAPHLGRLRNEDLRHDDENLKIVYSWNQLTGNDQEFYDLFNQLTLIHLIKCLRELGYDFDASTNTFTLHDVLSKLKVHHKFSSFVFYILLELAAEEYISIAEKNVSHESKFSSLRPLPTLIEAVELEASLVIHPFLLGKPEIKDVAAVGNNLSKILLGSVSPLAILFPESRGGDESMEQILASPAESYYKASQFSLKNVKIISKTFKSLMKEVSKLLDIDHKSVCRILEIGAGTGSFTRIATDSLVSHRVEYTYTDISPVFFKHGENIFKDFPEINVTYSMLDIEEDPMSQGFMPHQFDVVIAGYVVHATKDLQVTLRNIKRLLAPGGTLVLLELSKPIRSINILFGTLGGFSSFTDHDLRNFNCELESSKWEELLEQCGFGNSRIYPAYNDHGVIVVSKNFGQPPIELECEKKGWIIIGAFEKQEKEFTSKLKDVGRTVKFFQTDDFSEDLHNTFEKLFLAEGQSLEGIVFISGVSSNQFTLESSTNQFLHFCHAIGNIPVKRGNSPLKLILVTRNQSNVNVESIAPPSKLPFPSIHIGMLKAFQNENVHINCKSLDFIESHEEIETAVIKELFMDDDEFFVAYQGSFRHVKRCVPLKKALLKKQLPIPKTKRFHAILPESKAIEDLCFAPAPQGCLKEHDIEVQIVSYSLNFRDVLVVLKPSHEYFDNATNMGLDYAGTVVNVGPQVSKLKKGDAVFGISLFQEALPSSLTLNENFCMKIPNSITFDEAATLPAVAATVYKSFVETANLKKDDTVLIHTASGGVGLAAIQFAQHIGCRIVATAGNERKRAYLRKLGVEFVYDSRSTNYLADIRKDVGGVDVVLNSLTSPGFKEASLTACNFGASFVEMSKLNVWSKEEVHSMRPDVTYSVVDLSSQGNEEAVKLLNSIEKLTSANIFRPLPYVRFEAGDIREALTYLQKAKHIGKIICRMPQLDSNSGVWISSPFNDRSTYLITGGLGGIGWETCKWMVKNGAKFIVLTGRSPPNESAAKEIMSLNNKGSSIHFFKCDVGDFENCNELLNYIQNSGLPTLRGIMHAAGVISDGSFENHTWDKFKETFQPKVNGSLNLHQLTLNYPLEHFVFFSSAVASLGSLGQANHCTANTFMDNLAFYRHSLGLPATTINWGQWGQVGVAANKEVVGIKPMTTLECISALEISLRQNRIQTVVCEIDMTLSRQVFRLARRYLEEINLTEGIREGSLTFDSVKFWKNYDEGNNYKERTDTVKSFLKMVIKQVVRLPDEEVIGDEAKFQEMGMDSLMMIEMKNQIQSTLGDKVQVTNSAVKDCKNIKELSRKLVELISGDKMEALTDQLPREELIKLLREDSKLPENIQIIPGTTKECLPSEISTVFVTGASGNLGCFILQQLCKRDSIKKIICLVRPRYKLSGKERLETVLKEKELEKEINLNLVEIVEGDVTQDFMGLTQEAYDDYAGNADAIIHLSVNAAIQEFYCKAEEGRMNPRSENLIGTINALRFAVHKKVKHVYHASTLLAANAVDEDNFVKEDWPELDEFDGMPNNSYMMSKFVSDILVGEGVKRGIPAKVFRLPLLSGESVDRAVTNLIGNHVLFRIMVLMRLGVMPLSPLVTSVLPIRQATEISLTIFFDDSCGNEVYNIANPVACDDTEIPDMAEEFGYNVKIIKVVDFYKNIEEREDAPEVLDVVKATIHTDIFQTIKTSPPVVVESWSKNKMTFWSKKMEKLLPNYPACFEKTSRELLMFDLQCAKNTGVFDRMGLK